MRKFFVILALLPTHNNFAQQYRPGDQELFFMPTAYTMPEGQAYFADYEVFLLNIMYAPTNSTHLGLTTLFPVSKDFLETVTVSAKQRFFESEYVSSALFGALILKSGGYIVGDVISIGTKEVNFHAGFGITGEFSGGATADGLILFGGKVNVSEKISLLAEYTGTTKLLDSDHPGMLSFGIRFVGENTSWDLAAVRLLGDNGNDYIFLYPFLKAVFYF